MTHKVTYPRINIGCGDTPTPGWINYDNSLSIRLAKHPFLAKTARIFGLLHTHQLKYVRYAAKHDIEWADATKHIPHPDSSVEIVYCSHMLEHLDKREARLFLTETYRVLVPGGIMRIAVPDLQKLLEYYMKTNDADLFMEKSLLAHERPKPVLDKVKYAVVGHRHHLWMYDGNSLSRLLLEMGYQKPVILKAGQTTIPAPGDLNLYERELDSVYVEAYK